MSKDRRFCFTINNYTPDEELKTNEFLQSSHVLYGVVGKETGDAEGTPHLQGFVIFKNPQRFSFFHRRCCPRAHLEVTRKTSQQAADYCKKEGDWAEYGTFPGDQGRRSDIDAFKEWVAELDENPSERTIARAFPELFLRYKQHLIQLAGHLRPLPAFGVGVPRRWQAELETLLEGEPDDRRVNFYVDSDGGKGKSWFIRRYMTIHPEETQVLSIGKRDDLAHAIDPTCSVFLFDIPRGSMEYFQYAIVEKLKDQIVFSGKYNSTMKILAKPVHVVVFSNEEPDWMALTHDRYNIVNL